MDKRNPDGQSSAQLIIHQRDQADRTLPLHGDGYRIGRDAPLEVSIDHPAVSRQHAVLQRQGRHWILQDLNSTNGLWWKGRRVTQLELRDGDVIQFAPAIEKRLPSYSSTTQPVDDAIGSSAGWACSCWDAWVAGERC